MRATILLLLCVFGAQSDTVAVDTLRLVHVLFRHGDRTPELHNLYPKDPYLNDSYFPIGYGGLTNVGKEMEFQIGYYLRKRYDSFLGDLYYPNVIESWCTDVGRTKMSLELVLAGLWPPAPLQRWSKHLLWQPVPFEYRPFESDKLLAISTTNPLKPSYVRGYKEALEAKEVKDFLEEKKALYEYINENSGLNASTVNDIQQLYFGLYAEQQMGKVLPKWTETVFPEQIEEVAVFEYTIQTFTTEMIRESIGYFIKKIIEDSLNFDENKNVSEKKKMYLYSAHEVQVAHVLKAIGVKYDRIPPYSSYIIIELHEVLNQAVLKFYFQDYSRDEPEHLPVDNCGTPCTLRKFIELKKDIIPSDD